MIVDKIRADQARMSSLGQTAGRLLGQEMVIKRKKHLAHTEIIVRLLWVYFIIFLILFVFCCEVRDTFDNRCSGYSAGFYGKVQIDSSKNVCDDAKVNSKKVVWSKRREKPAEQPDGGVRGFIQEANGVDLLRAEVLKSTFIH